MKQAVRHVSQANTVPAETVLYLTTQVSGCEYVLLEKGIIITTGSFTSDARKEAVRDGAPPIELVDGEKLASMLEKLEPGLRPRQTFEVDAPFFDEFKK